MGRKIGLVMAMEEEMMQSADAAVAMDVEGSAETAMLEANDMDSEIEGQMDDMDVVADSSDELSNIADVMEKTTETGGMDEQTAEVVEVAVEGIYARMGVKRHSRMPALESFSNKTSKLQSTRIAIEGIREFVAAAWKKIIEAIASATAFIVDLVKKIFDVSYRMKERTAAYKLKIGKLKGKQPKQDQIKSGSFGKVLAMSLTNANFAAGVELGIKNITTATGAVTTLTDAVVKNIKSAGDVGSRGLLIKLPLGPLVTAKDGFTDGKNGMVTSRSPMLSGMKAFVSTYPEGNQTDDNVYSAEIKAGVSAFDPKEESSFTAETVKTATYDDMTKIIAEIEALCSAVVKNKEACEKLTSARKELLDKVKTMFSKSDKEPTPEVKKQQAFAMMFNKLTKSFMTDFNKLAVSSGMAALNYIQKSMEQYDLKEVLTTKNLGNSAKAEEETKEE